MENYLADDVNLDLQLDSSSKESLETASWWAKLIGIIYIAVMVLVIGAMIFFIPLVSDQLEYRLGITGGTSVIWMVMGILLLLGGVVLAIFMSFATKTHSGIRQSNQELLESGIASYRVYIIISGVLSILGILLNIFAFFGD